MAKTAFRQAAISSYRWPQENSARPLPSAAAVIGAGISPRLVKYPRLRQKRRFGKPRFPAKYWRLFASFADVFRFRVTWVKNFCPQIARIAPGGTNYKEVLLQKSV
jgi:hypothetical protein